MIYEIYHKTTFSYQSLVTFSHNIARIKPADSAFQRVLSFSMEIEPEVFEFFDFVDMFGNANRHILVREAHQSLSVVGKSRVELLPDLMQRSINAIKQNSITYAKALERLSSFHPDDLSAKQFLFESELIPNASLAIKKYALESFHKNRDIFEATEEFMSRIFNDFTFLNGFSTITTPIETIFEAKKGVCQDFAQFAISALRAIGLPAKYISGYIETKPPEGEEKLFGTDASHAWFSVYIPSMGWVGFDPTNNIIPTDQHIILGAGRDYNDISPLKGVVSSSGGSQLLVMVDVKRVDSKTLIQQQMQMQIQ